MRLYLVRHPKPVVAPNTCYGRSDLAVAHIMGQKPSAIAEKHYRRRPTNLLRMWHIKIEGWILEPVQAGLRVATAA